ncbi:hypothetical protein X777_10424, partial [Ooceraea biroi]
RNASGNNVSGNDDGDNTTATTIATTTADGATHNDDGDGTIATTIVTTTADGATNNDDDGDDTTVDGATNNGSSTVTGCKKRKRKRKRGAPSEKYHSSGAASGEEENGVYTIPTTAASHTVCTVRTVPISIQILKIVFKNMPSPFHSI